MDESASADWAADFRWSWRRASESERARWRRRARQLRRDGDRVRADYARARAATLAIDPLTRIDHCDEQIVWIECGCRRVAYQVGCGQRWICDHCRKKHYSRIRRRLLNVLDGHKVPRGESWVELRLSVRHSGDVAADRKAIVVGWRRLRSWLWKEIGARPFFLVHEVTPGRDGKGHVHAHVLTRWPTTRAAGSIDWSRVSAAWRRAVEDDRALIHIERIKRGPSGAASYFAKYASKGVDVGDFPPVLAGRVIAANYNQRLTSTSKGFWLGVPNSCACNTCESFYARLSVPEPIRVRAAVAHWDGIAHAHGVRGPPEQKSCFPPSQSKRKVPLH